MTIEFILYFIVVACISVVGGFVGAITVMLVAGISVREIWELF